MKRRQQSVNAPPISSHFQAQHRTDGWVLLCIAAWLGWLLDLGAAMSSSSPALRVHPIVTALGLTMNYAAWTAVCLLPIAGLMILERVTTHRRVVRWALLLCGACCLWLVAFLYVVSWVTYYRAAHFLNLDGLALFCHNVTQMFQHVLQVEAANVYLAVACSGILLAALGWLAHGLAQRLTAKAAQVTKTVSSAWACIGVLLWLILSTHGSSTFQTPAAFRLTPAAAWMEGARRSAHGHIGPFTGLAFDSAERAFQQQLIAARISLPSQSLGGTFAEATSHHLPTGVSPAPTGLAQAVETIPSQAAAPPGAELQETPILSHELGTPLRMPRKAQYPPDVAIHLEEVLDPKLPQDLLRRALTTDAKRIFPMSEYLRTVPPHATPRYNVIVILVESLRADRLRELGAIRNVLPHLDRLARRSVVCSEAYTQSSHSDYADVCTLSSHYPLRSLTHHFYEQMTYPRVLIYDILKALGYRTAIFSSQNERWGGMLNFLDTGNLDVIFHSETFQGSTYLSLHDPARRYWPRFQLQAGKVEDRDTVDAALAWIREQPDEPFFVYMNLQDSHFPYLIPKDLAPTYVPAALTFPLNHVYYPKWAIPIMQNRYDNSLRYIDSLLGGLFQHLEAEGLGNRTIVVVTGDTGQAFYEHGLVMHAGPLWNEVLRVPLVIHAPQSDPRVVPFPVQHIDIPPTILALLGLPAHPSFQGVNVLKETPGGHGPVFALAQKPWTFESAIIMNGCKLVQDWTGPYRLFDLRQDPREKVNLIGQRPEEFRQLQARLKLWHALQLLYYLTPEIHQHFYPPSIDQIESLLASLAEPRP